MAIRSRTREVPVEGHLIASANGVPYDDIHGYGHQIINSITDYTDGRFQPLSIVKRYTDDDIAINGIHTDGPIERAYNNFVALGLHSNSLSVNPSPHFSDMPSNSSIITSVLAKTNPSAAYVDLPLFIYELRELPSLFKTEGTTLLKQASEFNLQFQFGWKPLLSDLTKFFLFQEAVDNRFKELQALRDGGLRRKRTVWTNEYFTQGSEIVQSLRAWLPVNRVTRVRGRAWGYCEWTPSIDMPKTNDGLRDLARRSALGLNIDQYTLWNAIPWSWLVDWASNVGDFLEGTRNIVGATPKNTVVMRHHLAESLVTPDLSGYHTWPAHYGNSGTGWRFYHETKSRDNASASLEAGLPALTSTQFSILGSLAIWRKPNRSYLK